MSRTPRILVALCAVLATLLLAACGGDGDSTDTTRATSETTTTESQGGNQNVVIEAEDGAFDAHAIYEAASPGVVTVVSVFEADENVQDILGGGGGGGAGQGSGFVISEDGEILTNAHVITDAESTGTNGRPLHQADEIFVQFADRNQVEADVIGFDPFSDVALLKVDPDGLDLHVLPLGSESDVQVGDGVAAIGSPFGQTQSLSVGVVSATDRSIESLTNFRIDGGIQTDASINPGNSGGPLLDAEGQVVGINQQIQTSSGGNEGVGFAVPIDLAERAVDQLRDDGSVDYAFAGVTTIDLYPQLAERLGLDVDSGALVAEVVAGSPAADAGLESGNGTISFQGRQDIPENGDVIVSLNGDTVDSADDLPSTISRLDPGDKVTFGVLRDGKTEDIEITLGSRDDAPTN